MDAKQRAIIYQAVRSRKGPMCGRILSFLRTGGGWDGGLFDLLSHFPELELFKPKENTPALKPWFRSAKNKYGVRYDTKRSEKTRDIILLFCVEMAKKKKK